MTVPTSKKRLSGGARVVKHAPLARVQGEQHTFPNQAHTRMKWPIFAVFVSYPSFGPLLIALENMAEGVCHFECQDM